MIVLYSFHHRAKGLDLCRCVIETEFRQGYTARCKMTMTPTTTTFHRLDLERRREHRTLKVPSALQTICYLFFHEIPLQYLLSTSLSYICIRIITYVSSTSFKEYKNEIPFRAHYNFNLLLLSLNYRLYVMCLTVFFIFYAERLTFV